MANNIHELRKAKLITQREFAIAFEVTEKTIQNWESGAIASLWIERVIKFCEILDCEPKDLIQERNNG